jgi:hydrogenase small subunit
MKQDSLAQIFKVNGVSRRKFLQFCAALASTFGLSHAEAKQLPDRLLQVSRQSVIWLSFQECTGCAEAITRADKFTLDDLIFNYISLDYQHTLMAASGENAEHAKHLAMEQNKGKYILIVDGSIPLKDGGVYSTVAGETNLDILKKDAKDALAIVSLGSCAAFGGLPKANPNPTGAVSVDEIVKDKPIINIPGCPPIPNVISGVLAHVLTFGIPVLDQYKRPVAFYGSSIHDNCYRRPFYDKGLFADTFDDEKAQSGWCLYKLGCKGPITHNACAVTKWNSGVSFPIQSGHGCIGCSEKDFWDSGNFYESMVSPVVEANKIAGAAVAGVGASGAAVVLNKIKKSSAVKKSTVVDIKNLQQKNEEEDNG